MVVYRCYVIKARMLSLFIDHQNTFFVTLRRKNKRIKIRKPRTRQGPWTGTGIGTEKGTRTRIKIRKIKRNFFP